MPYHLSPPIIRYKQAIAAGREYPLPEVNEKVNAIQIFVSPNDFTKITIKNSPTKNEKLTIKAKPKKANKNNSKQQDPIKKIIKTADDNFYDGKYKKAAEGYTLALKKAGNDLEGQTVLQILKDLYVSQMHIWEKQTDPTVKLEKLKEASATLTSYLKKETNSQIKKDQIVSFWIKTSNSAFSHINDESAVAFEEYKILLEIYEKFGDKQDPKFPEYLDELHHNLTVCISNQEEIKENSSLKMAQEARELIGNSSASQEKKVFYANWLQREWDQPEMIVKPKPDNQPLKRLAESGDLLGDNSKRKKAL